MCWPFLFFKHWYLTKPLVARYVPWPGPLSASIKSKRHEIKSDPTPFGYEGTWTCQDTYEMYRLRACWAFSPVVWLIRHLLFYICGWYLYMCTYLCAWSLCPYFHLLPAVLTCVVICDVTWRVISKCTSIKWKQYGDQTLCCSFGAGPSTTCLISAWVELLWPLDEIEWLSISPTRIFFFSSGRGWWCWVAVM